MNVCSMSDGGLFCFSLPHERRQFDGHVGAPLRTTLCLRDAARCLREGAVARLQAQLAGRIGCRIALLVRKRVESDSDEGRMRERLASDLDAFGGELDLAHENAGHIAAGM